MTIAEVREKCKSLAGRLRERKAGIPRDLLFLGIIISSSMLSFGLGYLAGVDAGGAGETLAPIVSQATSFADTEVVASKSGTKYYPPNCAGAKRVSETNTVYFVSAAAARTAGYTPAENCASF